jgi:type I restriction enzyme M protein
MQREKASLDIIWLKDESLEDSDNLPEPEVLAVEIVESFGNGTGAIQVDL